MSAQILMLCSTTDNEKRHTKVEAGPVNSNTLGTFVVLQILAVEHRLLDDMELVVIRRAEDKRWFGRRFGRRSKCIQMDKEVGKFLPEPIHDIVMGER